MHKIPDETIFAPAFGGKHIDYGYVRSITDDTELINLLYLRLKGFFVEQVQPLQDHRSAFPLMTMTCVGIETLGQIFITEDKDDKSWQFVEVLKKIHQVFGRKPNKKYFERLKEIWEEKELAKLDSLGKIVYRFFRNTMVHGYQAKGMFLSYEDTSSIEIKDESAFMTVNPDWFWNNFKLYFEAVFEDTKKAQENNTMRKNCLKYIRGLLE